jgi:DNA-binding CsgD family transcriptional regulator
MALTKADADQRLLLADDLKMLSISAFLAGHDAECEAALVRGYKLSLERGEWDDAAQCAFWLGFTLVQGPDQARGSGWLERCRSIVIDHDLGAHGVAIGLDTVRARALVDTGDFEEGLAAAASCAARARTAGDLDVWTLAQLVVGFCLVSLRRSDEALRVFDEVMLAVADDDLSPPVTGMAYCAVIAACLDLWDLRRAREWTAALTSWCDDASGAVPYRGYCLVHRAQIMAMGGSWADALQEAKSACELLREPALGLAWYALGELHRLAGSYADAEDAYRTANALGQQPEPGLAKLRLAQGRVDEAASTMRRLLAEPSRSDRAEVLATYAEVMLAAREVGAARAASDELTALAAEGAVPMLVAGAAETAATVLCAEGASAQAVPLFRQAWQGWRELGMPYDAARVRVRMGDCCRALGDESSAQLEYDAARVVFEELGALPDLERLDGRPASAAGGLTAREVEVVRLVAAGHTNREIARRLVLSEKTVARHLSNVYAKLDIGSRAAATAYAYDHHLV